MKEKRRMLSQAEQEELRQDLKNTVEVARNTPQEQLLERLLVGKEARAKHPITCLNPTPTFRIAHARIDDVTGHISIRGENTMWFGENSFELLQSESGAGPSAREVAEKCAALLTIDLAAMTPADLSVARVYQERILRYRDTLPPEPAAQEDVARSTGPNTHSGPPAAAASHDDELEQIRVGVEMPTGDAIDWKVEWLKLAAQRNKDVSVLLAKSASGACLRCAGTGSIDDAELGDISFNTVSCPNCGGSGRV